MCWFVAAITLAIAQANSDKFRGRDYDTLTTSAAYLVPVIALFTSDSVYLCVRIPKSGSVSMASAVTSAFFGRRIFYLPNTLELDGRLSRFQHFRYVRARRRNLIAAYGLHRLDDAFAAIRSTIGGGDLISGGHIDFPSVSRALHRPVKIITMMRNPYRRSVCRNTAMRVKTSCENRACHDSIRMQ